MLTVKEAAKVVGIAPHTVRYYDERGLLLGVQRDGAGARLFDEAALDWLRVVAVLRGSIMPIKEIERYVALSELGGEGTAARKEILEACRTLLLEEESAIAFARSKVEQLIDQCKKGS